MTQKLTVKQQRFVDAYSGNATEAARLAGYSGSDETLRQTGAENLAKPHISELIKSRENDRQTFLIMTREERQIFWSDTIRDEEQDMSVRLRASELLGKSEGDFIEKKQIEMDLNLSQESLLELIK